MTELEKKLLLTEDEYDYLMERFGYGSPLIQKPIVTQINYYFDTDDFSMNRRNTTCRIRLKGGKYRATMKRHSSEEVKQFCMKALPSFQVPSVIELVDELPKNGSGKIVRRKML